MRYASTRRSAWRGSLPVVALLVHERAGGLVLATVTPLGAALDLERMTNHVVFLGMVGLILGLWADEPTRRRLLRVQLCVVYLFAAISKLSPDFVSGDVIARRGVWLPMPQALAIAAICCEALMALAVLRDDRRVLWAAVALHAALVLGWTTDFLGHGPGILVFNSAIVAVVAVVCAPDHVPRSIRRAADALDERFAGW